MTVAKAWNGTAWEIVSGGGNAPGLLFTEEFDGDLSAYSHDAGAASDWTVSGGAAKAATATAEKRILRTGVAIADSVQWIRYKHSATSAGASACLFARRIDVNNCLIALPHDTGLHIFALDAGSYVQKTGPIAITTVTGGIYWMRFSVIGNIARAEWYSLHPKLRTLMSPIVTEWAIDVAKFQAGVVGGVGLRGAAAAGSREIEMHQAYNAATMALE